MISFTSAYFIADWISTFLLVRSFSFHTYMNDRSDRSIGVMLMLTQTPISVKHMGGRHN